jgi:hypothetical protein
VIELQSMVTLGGGVINTELIVETPGGGVALENVNVIPGVVPIGTTDDAEVEKNFVDDPAKPGSANAASIIAIRKPIILRRLFMEPPGYLSLDQRQENKLHMLSIECNKRQMIVVAGHSCNKNTR